jgi:hypothetical protein
MRSGDWAGRDGEVVTGRGEGRGEDGVLVLGMVAVEGGGEGRRRLDDGLQELFDLALEALDLCVDTFVPGGVSCDRAFQGCEVGFE